MCMTITYDMTSSVVLTLRVDTDTERAIARLARLRRQSKSEVVREAVAALLERAPVDDRPYEEWQAVIGVARGGPAELSERTGERFREILTRRRQRS